MPASSNEKGAASSISEADKVAADIYRRLRKLQDDNTEPAEVVMEGVVVGRGD